MAEVVSFNESEEVRPLLTWSPGSLLGGSVLAFSLDSGRVEDPRGGAVLAKVFFQAFNGSIQLVGPDLEIDVHEVCGREEETYVTYCVDV